MKVKKFAAILTGMALIMSDSALVTASDAQTEAGSVVSAGEFVSESEGSDGQMCLQIRFRMDLVWA
jgi:hypothetical protein